MESISTHSSSKKRLSIALGLGLTYFAMLVIGSHYSGSLSLGANAGHMLMHSSVLFIALIASTIASKAANDRYSAGYGRVESIGAFINAFLLIGVALYIGFEAFERHEGHSHDHNHGLELNTELMSILAVCGLILHTVSALVLFKGRKESLNVYAAFLHLFFDVFITVATLTTAILIHHGVTEELDTYMALAIAAVILASGGRILWLSTRQLMDAVPKHIKLKEVISSLEGISHVCGVHNVIIRSHGNKMALSAHIILKASCIHSNHWITCRKEAEEVLKKKFDISYSILQMEVDEEHAHSCDHESHS